MIGAREVVHPRLRYLAAQFHPIPRLSPRTTRNVGTIAYGHTPVRSRWPRRFVYFGIFGGIGAYLGYNFGGLEPPPIPGSEMDILLMEDIAKMFNELPLVRQLRGDADYVEAHVYGNYSDEDKEQRLTSGPFRGSGRLAIQYQLEEVPEDRTQPRKVGPFSLTDWPVQKVFWNHKEKQAINVVFAGKGIEGWPHVVHGGAIATLLDEHLARVAIQNLPERTAVTANLDINYRNLAISNKFFSIHATLDQERSTDRKAYVKGEVRDVKGNVCADATGLFVVPRGYKLRRLGDTY